MSDSKDEEEASNRRQDRAETPPSTNNDQDFTEAERAAFLRRLFDPSTATPYSVFDDSNDEKD